jgi:uncharacterized protein YndB with AHSA1/START domain
MLNRLDQDRQVRREIELDAPLADVWRALTDTNLLGAWLGDEVELDPAAGGAVSVLTEAGERREGSVVSVEEASRLVFTWTGEDGTPSRVTFEVEEAGRMTRLRVTETRLDGSAPRGAAAAWSLRLESLHRCLASLVYA